MQTKRRLSTGSSYLDTHLLGGFASGELTLIFGEPGTGKTNVAICAAAHLLQNDPAAKTIYIDSDSKFTPTRLTQITSSEEVLKRLIYVRPTTFDEQAEVFDHIMEKLQGGDLVCIDSVTGLYRVETTDQQKTFMQNKELNRQLGLLKEIALIMEATVILTGQVRSIIDSPIPAVEPVAQRILRYWSDKVIRLDNTATQGVKQATMEKPRGLSTAARFRITEKGLEEEDRW